MVPEKYRPREKQARSLNTTTSLSVAGAVGTNEKRRPVDSRAGAGAEAAAPGAAGRDTETQSTSRVSEASDRTVVDTDAEQSQEDDRNIVTWYGPDDPENPKNWYVCRVTGTRTCT